MESLPKIENKNNNEENITKIIEKCMDFSDQRNKIRYVALSFYKDVGLLEQILEANRLRGFITKSELNSAETSEEIKYQLMEDFSCLKFDEFFSEYFMFEEHDEIEPVESLGKKNQKINTSDRYCFAGSLILDTKSLVLHFQNLKNSSGEIFQFESAMAKISKALTDKGINSGQIEARSWLLSVPQIQERIGFKLEKTYQEDINKVNDSHLSIELWGQLLDENNEIKEKVLEYLYKNRSLPYPVSLASMSIEDLILKNIK